MATVIAFISGKEGVGKTNIISNLAISLAARNSSVCLFDTGSIDSENINVFTGFPTTFTLENVLSGEKTIDEVTFKILSGVSIVSAVSTKKHIDLNSKQLAILHSSVEILEKKFDFILIDTIAGINCSLFEQVVSIYYRVIVITPEPRSLTLSFDLLRQPETKEKQQIFFIWVNRVSDYQASTEVFDRFQKAVNTYLRINVYYLGYLTDDKQVNSALLQQVPVVISYPESAISCGFSAMADVVKRRFEDEQLLFLLSKPNRVNTEMPKPKKLELEVIARQEALGCGGLIDIYNFVERQYLQENQLKEFIVTLENIYQRKYKKPIREVDSLVAILFADANAESIKHFYYAIADNYELQFGKKISRGVQALLKSEAFTRQKFDITIKKILDIYRKRFNEKYVEKNRK